MNLADMRALVRRDLHDEESGSYRWTNDELDRHILRAVKDLSEAIPQEHKALRTTTPGSREIDISSLTDRVSVEMVEYPAGLFPAMYQRFSLWAETVTLLGDVVPDGSEATIYYGKLHTLDATTSTMPAFLEDLVALGAAGYAAVEWAVYSINRVNTGPLSTPAEFLAWGNQKLAGFRRELKRLGRKNRVRIQALFQSCYPAVSKTRVYGP